MSRTVVAVAERGDGAIERRAHVADIAAERKQRFSHCVSHCLARPRTMVTPTSAKVAAIGACGLCTVTRTLMTWWEPVEHRFGDRAGRGLDQPIAPSAKRLARDLDHLVVAHGVRKLVGARGLGQIDVEREVELERLPDLGLVLHHAVIGMQRKPAHEHRVGHCALRMAAFTRSACTVSATSWVRMIAAPPADRQEMSGDRSAEPPVGRGGRNLVDEALARGADAAAAGRRT